MRTLCLTLLALFCLTALPAVVPDAFAARCTTKYGYSAYKRCVQQQKARRYHHARRGYGSPAYARQKAARQCRARWGHSSRYYQCVRNVSRYYR